MSKEFRDVIREMHQRFNEENFGVYCYYNEDNPCEHSLWRLEDDTQLSPWFELGKDGLIWVDTEEDGEYFLLLEYRDDEHAPGVVRQGLMHLPSGKYTGLIFAGYTQLKLAEADSEEMDVVIEGVQRLDAYEDFVFIAHPYHETYSKKQFGKYALYDKDFSQLLPSVICGTEFHYANKRYVYLWIEQETSDDELLLVGLYDIREKCYLIPPRYSELFDYDEGWIGVLPDHHSHRFNVTGALIRAYEGTVHKLAVDDRDLLACERDGLWRLIDDHGNEIIEPVYQNKEELLSSEANKRYKLLKLQRGAVLQAGDKLNAEDLQLFIKHVNHDGISIKYEWNSCDEYSDGYFDCKAIMLIDNVSAILLEDRYGDLKSVVLLNEWNGVAPGSMLGLEAEELVPAKSGSKHACLVNEILTWLQEGV